MSWNRPSSIAQDEGTALEIQAPHDVPHSPGPLVNESAENSKNATEAAASTHGAEDLRDLTQTAGDPSEDETSTLSSSNLYLRADTESDEALGDMEELESSTTSLRSSLLVHVEENGRTYHKYKEGSYLLPNDEIEQDRLDLQHHLSKLTLRGKSHLAPIKPNPHKVLDFGTGTGIWAIEFAQEYPSADVLGTDLSPIQPLYVPPNCRFEIDDAEDDWLYKQKFDYIHSRFVGTYFKDPAAVFKKAFHSCAPGGYFEMFDFSAEFKGIDDSFEGTALKKCGEMMIEGGARLGKDLTHAPRYKSYFEAAGFVDIVETHFQWPFNTWPKGSYFKKLGLWFNQDMKYGISGMVMAIFTRGLNMSREEVELFLIDVRKDLDDRKIHAYAPLYVVYGRKPE